LKRKIKRERKVGNEKTSGCKETRNSAPLIGSIRKSVEIGTSRGVEEKQETL
jgi:hypothetical protein